MLSIKKMVFVTLCLISTQSYAQKTVSLTYGQIAEIALSGSNIIENIYEPNSNFALAATCADAVLAYAEDDYGFCDYIGVVLASLPVAICANLLCPRLQEKNVRYAAIALSLFRLKNTIKKIKKEEKK